MFRPSVLIGKHVSKINLDIERIKCTRARMGCYLLLEFLLLFDEVGVRDGFDFLVSPVEESVLLRSNVQIRRPE